MNSGDRKFAICVIALWVTIFMGAAARIAFWTAAWVQDLQLALIVTLSVSLVSITIIGYVRDGRGFDEVITEEVRYPLLKHAIGLFIVPAVVLLLHLFILPMFFFFERKNPPDKQNETT
ncbi:MAG: hypothetical protein HYS52_00270 [Candidatus Wildermuthbacteria bacterium]|nr:hypothetical protein [Candidatus Wildermuthbacteria bacterium]